MKMVGLVLAVAICGCGGDDGGQPIDAPATRIDARSVDAQETPVDFFTVLGQPGAQWCLVTDRAHFGLASASPEAMISTGTEWCPHDMNCDGICAAWLGLPDAHAEFFVACDPATMRVRSPTCAAR